MMTEEHFHLLLRTVAAQTRSAGEERGGGGLRKVSANAFSRLTKFAKGEEDGKDWNFDIADILGMECLELLQNLKVIEPMSEEMTPKVRELDVDKADNMVRTLVGNPRSCLLFQPLSNPGGHHQQSGTPCPVPMDIGRVDWDDSAVKLGVDAIGNH